jgi:hypothetical protein
VSVYEMPAESQESLLTRIDNGTAVLAFTVCSECAPADVLDRIEDGTLDLSDGDALAAQWPCQEVHSERTTRWFREAMAHPVGTVAVVEGRTAVLIGKDGGARRWQWLNGDWTAIPLGEVEAFGHVYSRMVEVPNFRRAEVEQTHDPEPNADPRHEVRATFIVYTATADGARTRVLTDLGRWWETDWDFGVAVDGEWLENCAPIKPIYLPEAPECPHGYGSPLNCGLCAGVDG